MSKVNKINVNEQQVTFDADIIENMTANDVSYDDSFQYDENTVGDKLSELELQTNTKITKLTSVLKDLDGSSLFITDSYSNVIAKFDKNGLTTTEVNIKTNQNEGVSFLNDYDGDIYITDGFGNIAFKILSNGDIDFNGLNSYFVKLNSLFGKKIVGCGDSLSTNGYYEKDLADLSGGIYGGVFSKGGTYTIPNGNSTQDRVKSFVENGADADIFIIENVNDNWYSYLTQEGQMVLKGDISDKPFMLSQYYTPSVSYESASLAEQGFTDNFTSIITEITNKDKGTIINLPYTTSTIQISVNSDASESGTIQIILGENIYSITVTAEQTANQIALAINEYNFIGYKHSVSANVVTLTLQPGYTLDTVSFITNNTGVTMSHKESTLESYLRKAFLGHSVAEFSQIENWKTTTDISLYSYYKGIIEYLQTNCPTLKIVWFIPTTWILNFTNPDSSYIFEDGSWNMYGIMTSKYNSAYYVRTTLLHQIQKEVCEYYGVKCIDASEGCGITPFNVQTYYNSGDVHPKRITYSKWAEYIFNKLK